MFNGENSLFFSKKELEKLTKQGLITPQQAEQITDYYKTNNDNGKFVKRLFIIAALLIALGIILVIGANWALIPNFLKITADFILFSALVYADYYFITNNKNNLAEVFLVISFFMIAGSIGLMAQVYNLDGGWFSFARFWMFLAIPFVFLSKTNLINILWLILLFNSLHEQFYDFIKDIYSALIKDLLPFSKDYNITIIYILIFLILQEFYEKSLKLYFKLNKKFILPKAFSILVKISQYYVAFILAVSQKNIISIPFIFILLAYKMYQNFEAKQLAYFRNFTILTEIYIIFLFVSAYGNLFSTGIGFIIGGILIIVSIFVLRKVINYIKKTELQNEK